MIWGCCARFFTMSRSTWACELKFVRKVNWLHITGHAPRERVSWNPTLPYRRHMRQVTLHVSVWVEIIPSRCLCLFWSGHAPRERVSWNNTCINDIMNKVKSRSTWACELKSTVKLNSPKRIRRHAPRERVSWNLKPESLSETLECHAPRERVSWNLLRGCYLGVVIRHAPRERVSWNSQPSPLSRRI